MRAWLERSFRNRIFLTVLLVALVPLLLCDVLMTQVMIFRSEHTLRTDAQEEMALLTTQLDALLTDCGDVTRALAGSTVTRSALRRGGSDSRTLYQLLNRSTVALREYADFEVYGEDGDCLYTTANVWPAAQSTGLSCPEGEVDNSVFDRYIVPLYKQASYKPYIIAAMIFLAQVKDPVRALMEMDKSDAERKRF